MKAKAVARAPLIEAASHRIIGYARVSTFDQSTELQIDDLNKAGCTEVIKDDHKTGTNTARPGLQKLLQTLSQGDTLVVWRLDRLGRSLADLISILDDLKKRGVMFRSLREQIDMNTSVGRLMWQLVGAFAEFEHCIIKERVAAGQARARESGVKFGRPSVLNRGQLEQIIKMKAEGKTYGEICGTFEIGRTTLVRNLRRIRESTHLGLRPLG